MLNSAGGGGLLYWPLLATIAALMIPVGYEFLLSKNGMLQKYCTGCANWIAAEDTDAPPPLADRGDAAAALEEGQGPHAPPAAAETPGPGDGEALAVAHAEIAEARVELASLGAQVADLTRAKEDAIAEYVRTVGRVRTAAATWPGVCRSLALRSSRLYL